ncbi:MULTISPECIES: poly-gamma-glutamate hydrolase family protein [Streptomyces]|uniref:Poly-gamma-glutamate hydrolase family protein n=1 Tax=Streptomyces sudanensis TaxID=436397 RepID=A0ABY4T9P0_9ACTN|nr:MULTISPECIES: poly-gamma-glutamate hydrolase family protein [Streptomyces]MCP9988489.1 poly-gamma-glutamate hydrolase family protein [Streptomyces sudanensis]URN15687.1 poly-gamma-glutamate hydrolase family protein [Streptomyces sudanensis]
MTHTSRRAVLTALAAAAVTGPLLDTATAPRAHAAGESDVYASNTDLYTRLAGREGIDFARRYRRHEVLDHSEAGRQPYNRTTVLAMHGGAIEGGTSELCLGIAGYDPATLLPADDGLGVHDYWMFEGLRSSGNRELHVTANHNDDHVCRSMVRSSLNVLSLHGCTSAQAQTANPRAVVVGGLNERFKTLLKAEFDREGIAWRDGNDPEVRDLAGISPDNPCNSTMLGKGGQLELTTELRAAMFRDNTRAGRAGTLTDDYRNFVRACRTAIARLHQDPDQVIL